VANHVEAHLAFSPSNMAMYILRALHEENIERSIINSSHHVGIEPFDSD